MNRHVTPDIARACIDRMREAFDPGTGLHSKQLRDRRWDRTEGTEEITSTAICLLAASRAGLDGKELGLDVPTTIGLVFDHCAARYRGGLGLAVWMNAGWNAEPLPRLFAERNLPLDAGALGVRSMTTMEVAWLLCGLAHESARNPDPAVTALRDAVRAEAIGRYHAPGRLFRHAAAFLPAGDWIRRNVANFADQIYSVMAFSFDALAGGGAGSAKVAADCMARLVELQGELGQWWWHYHPPSGAVTGHFPVYSVHQHGMAPIALTAVSRCDGTDRSAAIERSWSWLSRNELGAALVDLSAGTIWRDIEPRRGRAAAAARHLGMVLGLREAGPGGSDGLEINHETRPYEWGWCLYFGSLDDRAAGGAHLV